MLIKKIIFIFLFLFFVACSNSEDENNKTPKSWYKPDVKTTWQWQLTGKVNTSYDVELYDIDLFDSSEDLIRELHEKGIKVICYFSAGSYENWRPDKDLFTSLDYKNSLEGWSGEYWLDIRRESVRNIMVKRIDLALKKGCDGIEPDNVDAYTNDTGFDLTYENQIDYNVFLANEAHKRNLAVALKNDLEQIEDLVVYFDFAINEQCHQYNECELLKPFVESGKPVFNAEYSRKYREKEKEELCNKAKKENIRTLILPLNLDDKFRISCDD